MIRTASFLVLALYLAACVGSRKTELPPDEQFGHRFDETGPEGRRTLDVTPPDSSGSYFYYPAVLDTVHVRPAPFTPGHSAVPVEILVKGSLPDACTELNEVRQERFGHLIEIELETRRPQRAVCAMVIRPFRFYLELEGEYVPGDYTLKLNDRVYPFTVRSEANR